MNVENKMAMTSNLGSTLIQISAGIDGSTHKVKAECAMSVPPRL